MLPVSCPLPALPLAARARGRTPEARSWCAEPRRKRRGGPMQIVLGCVAVTVTERKLSRSDTTHPGAYDVKHVTVPFQVSPVVPPDRSARRAGGRLARTGSGGGRRRDAGAGRERRAWRRPGSALAMAAPIRIDRPAPTLPAGMPRRAWSPPARARPVARSGGAAATARRHGCRRPRLRCRPGPPGDRAGTPPGARQAVGPAHGRPGLSSPRRRVAGK